VRSTVVVMAMPACRGNRFPTSLRRSIPAGILGGG
jgi:hypothetical protein